MFFIYALEIYGLADAFNFAIHSSLSYAIIIYGNALYLMPQFYRRKKYVAYFTIVLAGLVLIAYLRTATQMYIWYNWIIKQPYHLKFRDYMFPFIINCLFYVFSLAFRYTLDYFRIQQQQEVLLKQHAEAQLNLLKAQVQPHFLFNTLNNIYFVAQRESPLTADLIEKLSSIIRYFLEQGPHREIPLTIELEFIRNYIDLEKMRIRHPVKTCIEVDEGIADIKIPPMLLIPLVENVFKHGIDKRGKNNYITIRLQVSECLQFKVCNRIRADQGLQGDGQGTGLSNLSKRLQILYGDNYQLLSNQSQDAYISHLTIPL
jgi:sensor histidine kinase YesM